MIDNKQEGGPPPQKAKVKPVSWFKFNPLQQESSTLVCSIPIISPQSTERGLENDLQVWHRCELKALLVLSVFESTLYARVLLWDKKIPVGHGAWPGSITGSSLPLGALDFSKDRENARSYLHLQP